jgi:hypothetical protein
MDEIIEQKQKKKINLEWSAGSKRKVKQLDAFYKLGGKWYNVLTGRVERKSK